MVFSYYGPSDAAAFTAGVLNVAWEQARQMNVKSDRSLGNALTEATNAPQVATPDALMNLLMPALPNLSLDTTDMQDSIARIKAIELDPLIDKLTTGFDTFISLYYPFGNELEAAIAWLESAIAGGSGINADVEAHLWNRDRDRLLRDAERTEDEAAVTWAARGYPLPPGAMIHQIQLARRDAYTQIAESSRTQAIKSFEAELENVRFAVGRAIELRSSAMNAAGDYVQALALGPKLAVELAVAPIDAQAKVFAATSDFYRAQLAAYEIPLRLSTAKDEIVLKTRELNQRSTLAVLQERVKTVMAGAEASATQAAALLNGFHARVGLEGQEQL